MISLLRPSPDIWLRPTHIMECNLLYSWRTNLKITFTAISRLIFDPKLGIMGPVKLTYKINHRSLQILLLSLTFKQHFLKTFRPSHMTAHSPYLSSELRGGGTESHLQSVWEEIAGGQGRTAEGISDSGWEFRGRNLSIHHSVPAFQAHSFLLKYFKQHCFEAHDQSVVVQEVISA